MNFKAYDILSSLVPGFLLLIVVMVTFNIQYNTNFFVVYTALAFLTGFLNNTISSWLEGFYFWTWGGSPSNRLLDGKDIWKVPFYEGVKVKQLLIKDSTKDNPSNGELFSIAMRKANNQKNQRVDDFNSLYAFSRALLTMVLVATIFLLIKHYSDWRYYVIPIPILFIVWLRTKQRDYYFCREVLNTYLQ